MTRYVAHLQAYALTAQHALLQVHTVITTIKNNHYTIMNKQNRIKNKHNTIKNKLHNIQLEISLTALRFFRFFTIMEKRRKKIPFSEAVKNVELMHKSCLVHNNCAWEQQE